MPSPCSICTHPRRNEIEARVANGDSALHLERELGAGRSSILRHCANHLGMPTTAATEPVTTVRVSRSAKGETSTHIVIPDTQVKPGVPTEHLEWIGRFIADEYAGTNLTVIHLGDHFDMPSLSSYDRGTGKMEGRRYVADIRAGNDGIRRLSEPFAAVQCSRIFLMGNHEDRITRAANQNAQLDGLLTLDDLDLSGWEVHGFRDVVSIDGVAYSHYFYNPMTGRPYSGSNLETRLKSVGHSFTMGHQQGLKWGRYDTTQGAHIGLVAGSCYIHDEDYLGPQTINYWRGIIVCHQVEHGEYDPMFVSLDYLSRRYTGKTLRWGQR